MKRILIMASIAVLSANGFAQLGNIKIKKPTINIPKIENPISIDGNNSSKNAGGSTNSSSSSGTSHEATSTKKIEQESENILALLDSYFNDGEENLKATSTQEIRKAMEDLLSRINTLKNYYANYTTKLPKITERYNKYVDITNKEYDKRGSESDVSASLKDFSSRVEEYKGMGESYKNLFINYSDYKTTLDAYNKMSKKAADLQTYITNIENYFDVIVPQYVANYSKNVKTTTLDLAFNENEWKNSPENGIVTIKNYFNKGTLEEFVPYSKDVTWINTLKTEIQQQQKKLEQYISSGEFDKYKSKMEKQAIDKVIPYKAVATDPSIDQAVRKYHGVEEYGTITKIIIVNDWDVSKNDFGIILDKNRSIQVITSQGGKCFLNSGYVLRKYEGGGAYGSIQLAYYTKVEEMNCANINKSK